MAGKHKRTATFILTAVMALILVGCSGGKEQLEAGMLAIRELRYEEALTLLAEAKEQGADERVVSRGLGIAYMGLTRYEEAAACFEEALKSSKGLLEEMDYDLNYYLAAAYAKSGHPAEAEKTYDAILIMRPNEPDAYFLRGNMRLEQGKATEATEDFDKVAQLEPSNYDRLIQIFEVLATSGMREQGQSYLRAALDRAGSKMTDYEKGRMHYYLEEYQEAYAALEKARDEGGAQANLYLGKAYEATGDYNYASNVYNAYLVKDSTNAEIYNQLGLCEMKKGEYTKALEAFQAGLQVENNAIRQTLAYNEVVAYEYLGEFEKALELIESYLKAYPDDEKARREADFLRTR